jgi:hypothetical protein
MMEMGHEISTELNFPDPEHIEFGEIPAVMAKLSAIQSQLATRLLLERQQPPESGEDMLLDVKQAAALLAVKSTWLYRRSKTLPFTKRLSRGNLRFSKRGLLAWRDRKRS